MTGLEKGGALIGVVAFAFTIGVGWNALNNRIEQVDSKVASIQAMLGTTTCTAILSRQIEAIEKGRVEARKALEGLSGQYNCIPSAAPGAMAAGQNAAYSIENVMMRDDNFANQIEAVDVLLKKQD